MQRFLKIVSWVLAALFVVFVLLVVTVYVRRGYPTIELETSGKNIIVHLETLADYPTHIDRIVITKKDHPDQKVFEAVSEDNAQIRQFRIHAGENQFGVIRPTVTPGYTKCSYQTEIALFYCPTKPTGSRFAKRVNVARPISR